MNTTSVKVGTKHRITLPQISRRKLNIKKGDHLLVDVQDSMIVLMPELKRYTDHLQGLHGEIWQGIDTQRYLTEEREAWTKSAKG